MIHTRLGSGTTNYATKNETQLQEHKLPTLNMFPYPKRKTEWISSENTSCALTPPIKKKLRIIHDRWNIWNIDKLFHILISTFPLLTLQNAVLVSKRWHLFACNRLNHLYLSHEASSLSDDDLDEAVTGLEKMKDMVNQRLQNLSEIKKNRIIDRFYHWHDNGQQKQQAPTLPNWIPGLKAYGFPFQRYCTYAAEDLFRWVIRNEDMDDNTKEFWVQQLVNTNVEEFSYV